MRRLKRFLLGLALFSLALPRALPQSYSITEAQLAALEEELRTQRQELERQKELLSGQETLLQELNEQLARSAEELRSSQEALAESRQALQEARQSLNRYDSKRLKTALIAGAASLVVGVAGGLVGGYFIGR